MARQEMPFFGLNFVEYLMTNFQNTVMKIDRLNARHFCWQARDSHLYCFGVDAGSTLFISCNPLLAVMILVAIIFTLNLTSCACDLLVNAIQIVYISGNRLDSAIAKV